MISIRITDFENSDPFVLKSIAFSLIEKANAVWAEAEDNEFPEYETTKAINLESIKVIKITNMETTSPTILKGIALALMEKANMILDKTKDPEDNQDN